MDIQEKILKVINYSVGEGGIDTSSNEMVDAILSAVRQEVSITIAETDNTREYTPKEDMFGVGYEQMRTDIRTALQKKGLI